ncbi:hypothetical protein AAFC00_003816 [Neodothiora populina]|uniref:Pre-mRNA-splicing factor n=1 Tax=Neodothiora populina TaxID=2781224 RepID=A0ABR3PG14_9PEZI
MASFSISLGGGPKSRKASPPPPSNGVKRARAVLDDDESDNDDGNAGKRQAVTHFDAASGGAVDVSKPKVVKEKLVIQAQKNRDWKEASQRNRRQRQGLPPTQQEGVEVEAQSAPLNPAPATYGLNVRDTELVSNAMLAEGGQDRVESTGDEVASTAPARPQTDDERAIAALTGAREESTLTIPTITEEQAFERDVQEAPDAPTLAEYAAVPVEEFGAAMLRGMGWKEGQGIGIQKGQKLVTAKVPERRPALLGIGAKPDTAVAGELGAWGAGAKGRRRPEVVYNPLILKNSKTGEQLTEEELKAKLQEQTERAANETYSRGSEKRYRRDDDNHRRHDDYEYHDREERRRRERRKERDSKEHGRSRRDRSVSVDRRRERKERSISHDRGHDRRRDRGDESHYKVRGDRERRRKDRGDDYSHRSSRRERDRYDDDRERRDRR